MAFVQFSQVSLAFGHRDILKNVSLNLEKGSRASLTGANGSGKSSLMKIMAGLMEADSGQTAIQKDCRIVYLPQSGIVHRGTSLRSEADRAFSRGYDLHAEMQKLGEQLTAYDLNAKTQKQLLERHHQITEDLTNSGWYRRNIISEQVLTGLGFLQTDFDRPIEEFSGGWQMRVALAKALLQNPDILLLDEPTNYLDIEARTWLEEFLLNFSGGFILVSHDRYFLDVCVNEVYELFNGELRHYTGNYSRYEELRRIELESLTSRYEQQQEEIHKLEDFVRRFRYKASKAAQAQERLKQLEKMERIEIPESLKKIHFKFPPSPHSGRLVLTLEGLNKTYSAENPVIRSLDLVIEQGERLAVVGRNGMGKSTLLRILAGADTAYTGTVKLGTGVKVGYFSQDNAEIISGSISVLDLLENKAPLEMIPKLRDILGAFLFRGDDVYKSLDVLSGGEKSRLALLSLLLNPVNLLILDEPTNHLDLHSKDVLLAALKNFNGSVIFVSHDRGFMNSLATRVLELRSMQSRQFPGSYAYYIEQTEQRDLQSNTSAAKQSANMPVSTSEAALSYHEQKRLSAERRKLEKEEQRLMQAVTAAEEKKAKLENQLADPAVYSDIIKSTDVQKKIAAAEQEIQDFSFLWEKISFQLAEFL